jgi:hypothetical protein
MKKPKGVTLQMGFLADTKKPKFRFSSLQEGVRPQYDGMVFPRGGIRLDLLYGTIKRPVPKFYKKEFWSSDRVKKEQNTNPWNSGKHWFVLHIPFCIGFLFSICLGWGKNQPGFYIGLKTYVVNHISAYLKKYSPDHNDTFIIINGEPVMTWCNKSELGNKYLCPSVSIRKDLVD